MRMQNPVNAARFIGIRRARKRLVIPKYGMLTDLKQGSKHDQERLTVRKIKEILRLKYEAKLSNRAIAGACNVSNSTVGEYLRRAGLAGIQWPLGEESEEKCTKSSFRKRKWSYQSEPQQCRIGKTYTKKNVKKGFRCNCYGKSTKQHIRKDINIPSIVNTTNVGRKAE